MQLSDLQYLMSQLGPASSAIQFIVQQDDNQWQIALDDGTSLQVSWQAERRCATFSCGIGQVMSDERENIYALLLRANLLLSADSSARLALSRPDDEVMLIGEYSMSIPSLDVLQQQISTFLQRAVTYAEMIARPWQAHDGELMPVPTRHDAQGYQRV